MSSFAFFGFIPAVTGFDGFTALANGTIDYLQNHPIPFAVMVGGLLGGSLLAVVVRRTERENQLVLTEGRNTDDRSRHAEVVEALRGLELERDKLSPEDFAREKRHLVEVGAESLRALDIEEETEPIPSFSPEFIIAWEQEQARLGKFDFQLQIAKQLGGGAPSLVSPEWRGALWALGTVCVVGLLGWYVSDDAGVRRQGAPMTGKQDLSDGSSSAPMDPSAVWLEKLNNNPNDLEALNRLTVLALSQQDPVKAMEFNERALAFAPKDPDARIQRAGIRAMMGMVDEALALLDEVLSEHPEHAVGWVYKGLLSLQFGKPELAVPALEQALKLDPGQEYLENKLAEAKALASGAKIAEQPASTSPTQTLVQGKISLSPGSEAALAKAKVLFVSLRAPGGGPPLAAKRLEPGPFPIEFEVTSADRIAMGGMGPLPESIDVGIRLDFDGNALSKDPAEPGIKQSNVKLGSTNLTFMLAPSEQ